MPKKTKDDTNQNLDLNNLTGKDLNKTLYIKPAQIKKEQKWLLVDAKGQTLGRLATIIADKLLWKDKAYYCDFRDCGSFVVVKNVEKMIVTGNKMLDKIYYKHTWRKGNMKEIALKELIKKDPSKPLWHAVRGMLTKNKLRDPRMQRLKMFVGETTKYDNLQNIQLETI